MNDIYTCTERKFVHDARCIFDYKNITKENSILLFNSFTNFKCLYLCMYMNLYAYVS